MTNTNPEPKVVYPTYGVHNPPHYSPCKYSDCIYPRGPGEPSNPLYPEYWSAKWTMYRVFNNYEDYPPPYDGKPPAALKEGADYQVSYGATYYDSTWRGPNGEQGAMMEHYEEWSLPIFPMNNHFTSSFISLGNTAYFVTYKKDRPDGMPPICLFSDLNHPPHRDFIKHLPYSEDDSQRLDGRVQAYSFWTSPDPDKPPIQVGARPDRTADRAIPLWLRFQEYVGAGRCRPISGALPACTFVLLLRISLDSPDCSYCQPELHRVRDDSARSSKDLGPGREDVRW